MIHHVQRQYLDVSYIVAVVLDVRIPGTEEYTGMAGPHDEPNLFELNDKSIQLTYSTSSITGEPQLSYRDQEHDHTFRGADVRGYSPSPWWIIPAR